MTDVVLQGTETDYRRRFREPNFGADLAEVVAERHGLARPLIRKVEGSNLVFHTSDGDWLKISPPFFRDAFDAEVAVTARVQGRLPASIPELKLTGVLDEDWRYLVSANVPGVAIGELVRSLTDADLESIAEELGVFMAAFHAVPPAGFDRSFGPWHAYLRECLDDAQALHGRRGNNSAQVEEIVGFLAPRRGWLEKLGPPVLIHADLTAEHVLLTERGGRWRFCGVLDLADAMVAPAPLDLIPPLLDIFRSRRAPQLRLLATVGGELDAGDRPDALMAVALQHRFMHFHDWFRRELADGITDIGEIAKTVFPI